MEVVLKSPAKINLGLFIVGILDHEYHQIVTILQKISLFDTIHLKRIKSNEIKIKSSVREIQGEKNIVYEGIKRLKKITQDKNGWEVLIEKRIPIGSGLGGGSSNLGVVLRFLMEFYGTPKEIVSEIAKTLGSDTFFFFTHYTTSISTGKGDILEPLQLKEKIPLTLFVMRNYSISTKEMYRRFREKGLFTPKEEAWQKIQKIKENLNLSNLGELESYLKNDFEKVIESQIPEFFEKKEEIEKITGSRVFLTGKGPTLYCLKEITEFKLKGIETLPSRFLVEEQG